MGDVTLGLDPMRQAEQPMGSKTVSNIPPWLLLQLLAQGSCLAFLSWLPFTIDFNLGLH